MSRIDESIQVKQDLAEPVKPEAAYVTAQEVADHYQVSKATVHNWVRSKKIPSIRIGNVVRIQRAFLKQAAA